MSKLSEYLKRPAPQIMDKPWDFVLLGTTIPLAVLAIFEPFAFRLNTPFHYLVLLGFGLLIFISTTLFAVVLPRIFKSYFAPEKWTLGRMYAHMACMLLFIGIFVFVYEYIIVYNSYFGYWTKNFFRALFTDIVSGITIGLIPVTISIYMTKSRMLKQNLQEAIQLNEMLSHRLKDDDYQNTITLEGTTKDSVSVNPNSILYVESEGNYIKIAYVEESTVRKKMLRSTIKLMEESLQGQNSFIRCHRAFIVNINHILKVSGNAQGYKLSLQHTDEVIPVSRTYAKMLKDSLK